ncbi:ribosomal protein S18-alanine N-acetyltransferase [Catenulispora pinisilvae]|uniref:ribosomal protein S18-alanine N-acetyltransferase n=2 Tax=Catenulispora pinisilvae TaxID=2705253 RepID=UPI002B273075|nr:ribosomal protein S18-alanine N-acetyltransferase [Catenulispora pinisilvae]
MSPQADGAVLVMAATLRPFRWWDIETVRLIEQDLFPEDPWSVEMFWSELADAPHSRYYVIAEDDGEIAGYAGLMSQPGADQGAMEGWVQNIAVARAHQGRGLGTVLLGALLEEALRRKCVEVWLEVRTDNDSAQRLYTRHGFESVGIRRGYYQPGNHDALIMRKALA